MMDASGRSLKPKRFLNPKQVKLLLSRGLVRQIGRHAEYSQVFFRGSLAAINAALRAGVRGDVPRAEDDATTRDGSNGVEHKWPVAWHPWRNAIIPGLVRSRKIGS